MIEGTDSTIPDWAKEQAQHDIKHEDSKDPYDKQSSNGNQGTNVLLDNKLLKVTKRDVPETIRIG